LAFIAAAILASQPGLSWGQDATNGEKIFKKCAACHAVGPSAKNKVGPVLNGLIGRSAGRIDGFKYSKAMQESGLTWDEASLGTYLHNPKAVVSGTTMAFPGLKKDTEIADVIAYLRGFAPDGSPQ